MNLRSAVQGLCLLGCAVVSLAAGCKGLVTSQDRVMSRREFAQLKQHVYRPVELGLKVIRTNGQTSVRWSEKVSPAEPITLPLLPPDSRNSVQPTLLARINGGRPVPVVVDTGAPVNLIHLQTALDNQVRVADPDQLGNLFRGLGGYEQAYFGLIDLLALGPLQFEHAFTAIRTHAYQRSFLGMIPVFRWRANSIGLSSLTRLAYFTIDYPARTATFSARQPFLESTLPAAARLPFKIESMQILVELRLRDTTTVWAMVDTGNDACLMLPQSLVAQLGFGPLAEKGKPGRYLGLGGEVATRSFNLSRLQVGNWAFSEVETVAAPDSFPATLGSGFLKAYKTTIDFRRKLLWLELSPHAKPGRPGESPHTTRGNRNRRGGDAGLSN